MFIYIIWFKVVNNRLALI